MTDKKTELRKQAEEKASHLPEDLDMLSPAETRQTLHELRVHQIELEIQNEELRQSQAELDAARARYFDLYDLAPVGYVTLSEKGLIREANLTAANLMGVARGDLVQQPLSRFILKEDQDIFFRLREQLLDIYSTNSGEAVAMQAYELRTLKKDGTTFWAHLETAVQVTATAEARDGTPELRIILSDITLRKQAEWSVQERLKELNCLYGISALVELPGISLDEILTGTVLLLPPAWQFPEIAEASIVLREKNFQTARFRETSWMQAREIIVNGNPIGQVEVCYLEERPACDEGPFLKEERQLLNAVAERLGRITERILAEEALEEERRRLQQALDEVRTLRGIVPICSYCKKIRDDKGYWDHVEKYVSDHSEAKFSHGICPACLEREMKAITK